MAQAHKSLPKPTARKTVLKRLKLAQKNLEILNRLSEK
jgi:hypothetical protein